MSAPILVRIAGEQQALAPAAALELARQGESVMVRCPECRDEMDVRRTDPRALRITNGRCEDCNNYEQRRAASVDRARRIATFGEGRC